MTQAFVPTAAWPWQSPRPREHVARDSIDPEAAQIEATVGLTREVVARYLDRFPAIAGALRRRGDVFRPLSLRGGKLVACELSAIPDDVDGWQALLAGVEHVQTARPEVCAALASEGRSFTVASQACAQIITARAPGARVVVADPNDPQGAWIGEPWIDHHAFIPVVPIAIRTWWCWDVDEDTPALVATEDPPSYFLGYSYQRLHRELELSGPLPLRRDHPPSAPLAHVAVAGEHWACALYTTRRLQPVVITRPPNRVAVFLPIDTNQGDFGDELAWRFVHTDDAFAVPQGGPLAGSLATFELVDDRRARIRWAGEHRVYLLRGGTLTTLAEPHLYARELQAQGVPRDELPELAYRVIMKGIGMEPDVLDVDLMPDDRLLACTDATYDLFDAGGLAELMRGDLRAGATRIQHALQRAGHADAALLFAPQATFQHAHPGWFPQLSLRLEPAPAGPATNERPQRFAIYHLDIDQPMQTPDPHAPPMWVRSLQDALARSSFKPEKHDLFRTWITATWSLQLQYDGTAWVPITSWYRPKDELLEQGFVRFREDTPTSALADGLTLAARGRLRADELEQIALREGFPELALWLRLEREHVEGKPGAGLAVARQHVSLAVRQQLASLVLSERPVAHDVDLKQVTKQPEHFQQCLVRYRTQIYGGAIVDREVRWPDGGASARDTPFVVTRPPRRVTAEDLRLDKVRPGVPVRAELVIVCDRGRWTWRDKEVTPPPGVDRTAHCRMRAEVVFILLERLVILEVLEVKEREGIR